ncbi:MAG TPA: TonB-dependent receptor [Bacteroidales bacterium]|nr:TonB-dependent receptor [Bacteroidales bacterium]
MKLTFLLFFVTMLSASAGSLYSQKATFDLAMSNSTVKEVISTIEKQSKFRFLYNDDFADLNKRVNVQTQGKHIDEVLAMLFTDANLTYRILDNNLIVITPSEYILRQVKVTGTVTDATTGEPLPGVNIVEDGTTNGVSTDLDGNYSINVKDENASLIFSFVGYVSQTIQVSGQNVLNVQLSPDVESLDEVVVVGYGTQRKSLVTGAISSVTSEDIQNTSSTRADEAIQGKTAGVMVLPTSGSPGAATKIRIRGTNSNGNSNPLFIVDGMKTGDINNIAPGDIESIEVLKDAASAAIYGTEGSNGVVIITTKMGKAGQFKVNYDFQYGIQSLKTKMEVMDANQYTEWMNEAGATVSNTYNANTDWMSEVFQNAPMQKHRLSFSGGNDKTTYMISGSYLTQDGIVGGSKANYNRYTGRINVKSNLKKWLEVGTNLSYMHQKRNNIGEDDEYRSLVNNTLLIDPLTPVTYDGTPQNVQDLLDQGKVIIKNDAGKYFALTENVTGETANPLAVLKTYHNYTDQDKLMGTVYGKISPFEGLSFTSRIGLDLTYQTNHFWTPEYYFSPERSNPLTSIDDRINKWNTWLWENFATYTKAFGAHDFTILAGYSAQQDEAPYYSLHSGPMVAEGDQYAHTGYATSSSLDQVTGTYDKSTMASFFGRLSYNYAEKYLLEGSIRRDGASVFPTNNKYALFPAISAGWVVSKEDFFNTALLNNLKLRASWGANGSKANLPGNEDRKFWVFSQYGFPIRYPDGTDSYQSGARIEKLPNPDLVWERTEMTDIGVDLGFFNNRLTFSADYYNKLTKDLIAGGTGPFSVGNNYPNVNAGDVQNKGWDFELGYRNYSHDLKYGVNVNLSTNKNEVTSLKVDAPVRGDNLRGYDLTWFEEGYPIWYFKGYKTNGIDEATGDPIVVDVNGDGVITPDDQTYIGDPHPDLIFGANVYLEYKSFDFKVFVQGTSGNDIFMGWFRTDRPLSNKPAYFYEDRWTSDHTSASFPAANNVSDYIYRSDLMVADGSYLRVKQIQLGYTVPADLTAKVGVSSLRAFVSLDNYFTITGYKGLDPEAGSSNDQRQGVDRGIYPAAGIFLFGLSVNF